MKKGKRTHQLNAENKKKNYHTFPNHLDAQPIPSIISSLKFDNTFKGCFAIFGS